MYLIFWLMNMYFVWNGTESIKTLETWAAPFLIGIGLVLLGWGVTRGGGLGATLDRSNELARPVLSAQRDGSRVRMKMAVLVDLGGSPKAKSMQLGEVVPGPDGKPARKALTGWIPYAPEYDLATEAAAVYAQFDSEVQDTDKRTSTAVEVEVSAAGTVPAPTERWKIYLLGLTAMVGFWATLALNIPDITRLARSQRDQALGQAIGLPLTMGLYSFIGLAVTCATLNIFPDLVIGRDAIWDPVALLSRFDNPMITIIAMIMLAVATLTTNIAANVISPANSFAAAFPEKISARTGGVLAACLGILMMPWKLLNMYLGWLIGYSGLLGPVIGVMVVDYYLVRKTELDVDALYTEGSAYAYQGGFNTVAILATGLGIATVVLGWMVPALSFLAEGAWFSAAIVAGGVYYALQPRPAPAAT
jgi:cytosine/uracil/thiamine/allantoin permease